MNAVLDRAIWPLIPNENAVGVRCHVAMVQSTSGVEVEWLGSAYVYGTFCFK